MSDAAARENIFGHLDISRRLAAASVKVAELNPTLSRELADQAKEILAFVERNELAPDLSTARDAADDLDSPEGEARFQRVRALQKRMMPVPGDGPRNPNGHDPVTRETGSGEPVVDRISAILRGRLQSLRKHDEHQKAASSAA